MELSKELPPSPPEGLTNDLRSTRSASRLTKLVATYTSGLVLGLGIAAAGELTIGADHTGRSQAAPPVSPPAIANQYNAKLVAHYKSSFGIKFNVYSSTRNKDGAASNQAFIFNPRILEFSLKAIDTLIHHAPENPAKHSIIENLANIKAGKAKKTIHMIVDTSEQIGCLDSDDDFVKYNDASCIHQGAAITASETDSIDLISTGKEEVMSHDYPFKANRLMSQHATILHELIHNLSSDRNAVNAYREGDHDHEITSWMIGEHTRDNFDAKGADLYDPELSLEIGRLTINNHLPPLLRAVGDNKTSS